MYLVLKVPVKVNLSDKITNKNKNIKIQFFGADDIVIYKI